MISLRLWHESDRGIGLEAGNCCIDVSVTKAEKSKLGCELLIMLLVCYGRRLWHFCTKDHHSAIQ